jgi:hypothetical protein
MIIPL